jgi:hypothetical protein
MREPRGDLSIAIGAVLLLILALLFGYALLNQAG